MKTIRSDFTDDRLCVVTFDRPDSSANVFDRATLEELHELLDRLAGETELRGVVFTSAKPKIFIAGADLRGVATITPSELAEMIRLGQTAFARIAELAVPTVAAIHGACVGGGYELTLACDWRVATDDRATRIGLPETKLGILPAWGGPARLPRLIGVTKALDIILNGKTVPAVVARKRGMIDEVAPRDYLMKASRRLLVRGKRPPRRYYGVIGRLIAPFVRAKVLKKTRACYPAILEALDVVVAGGGSELESAAILRLAKTEACKNLIRVFFLSERARKLGGDALPRVQYAAVIGAGVMGSGIAQWLAARGVKVLLKDIDTDCVARGMGNIAKLFRVSVKKHALSRIEARDAADRIFPIVGEAPMNDVEFIVEAAVERLEPKKKIFASLEAPNAVLATNTSALPITEIASVTSDPTRVVGLHFFNPVHRMQLVEIARGAQTSDETVGRAVSFVHQIGKYPVVVKDSPGFLINRILMPYLSEAGRLFERGARILDVDEAMLGFGMPMGPLRLLDEVGIDIANDVGATLSKHLPERMELPLVLKRMIERGWLGRKSGRGFYVYHHGKSRPNSAAEELRIAASAIGISRRNMKRRMVLLLVNESARCLEEEIVGEPDDVDFAMIMGTGFAPFRGGPLRFADTLGLAGLVDEMSALGGIFSPCAFLCDMAGNGRTFYNDETSKSGQRL
jgi:3-hydroxyacyl-CoA dehydrogenase/enoyl-CoA hydratase/3-hydroxybutyryl-CoA epimerase